MTTVLEPLADERDNRLLAAAAALATESAAGDEPAHVGQRY